MTTTLAFVDTETTGLDPRIHQPYEVCIWLGHESEPSTLPVPHTLQYADRSALRISRYIERGFSPWGETDVTVRSRIVAALQGATLVGSSPHFDAAMLARFIGCEVWDHRLIDVSQAAMWVFGWDRPCGLAKTVEGCREAGYEIPEPDHTAEGDVRATRAVYDALRAIRGAA